MQRCQQCKHAKLLLLGMDLQEKKNNPQALVSQGRAKGLIGGPYCLAERCKISDVERATSERRVFAGCLGAAPQINTPYCHA
jgi:hypothetical protein